MKIENNLEDQIKSLSDEHVDYLNENSSELFNLILDEIIKSGLFPEFPKSSSKWLYNNHEKVIGKDSRHYYSLNSKRYSNSNDDYSGINFSFYNHKDHYKRDNYYNSKIRFEMKFFFSYLKTEKKGFFNVKKKQDSLRYFPFKYLMSEEYINEEMSYVNLMVINSNELVDLDNKEEFKYNLNQKERNFIQSVNQVISNYLNSIDSKIQESKNSIVEVQKKVSDIISQEFDIDQDGELDILNGDNLLMDLLNKHQSTIVEFDHTLIQKIIKLNNFLKVRKSDLNVVFDLLKGVETDEDLEKMMGVLRLGIKNTNSILVLSLEMIVSIKEKELVTFYEIYESFDQLGIFNSNWENEVTNKLSGIDSKLSSIISSLKGVMFSINSMERSITSSINNLTYVTSQSYLKLQSSVTNELKSIRSGVEWNTLLTGIQSYQTHRLRQGK